MMPFRVEEGESIPLDAAAAGVLAGHSVGLADPVVRGVEAGGVEHGDGRRVLLFLEKVSW